MLFFSLSFFFVLFLQQLTKGPHSWSLSEIVHAIVLLSHFHSLSSFVFSCGLTQELDPLSSQKYKSPQKTAENSPPPKKRGFTFRTNTTPLGALHFDVFLLYLLLIRNCRFDDCKNTRNGKEEPKLIQDEFLLQVNKSKRSALMR